MAVKVIGSSTPWWAGPATLLFGGLLAQAFERTRAAEADTAERAMAQHLAGVHRDDILQDYLLTNDEQRIRRRMETFRAWLVETLGREAPEPALRAALTVDARYLETALNRIDQDHGSLDRYLEDALHLQRPLRERIAARIRA